MALFKSICGQCGSSGVFTDATASFDILKQEWVLECIQEYTQCRDCERAQDHTVIVELQGAELAEVLIKRAATTEPVDMPTRPFCSRCHSSGMYIDTRLVWDALKQDWCPEPGSEDLTTCADCNYRNCDYEPLTGNELAEVLIKRAALE